ncbi:MAG: YfhO family protein [Steroidobacteraceae bacterium]|nr:YfhO family protein [Deltaproteobacteria bacterium]
MTERRKDFLCLTLFLAVLLVCYSTVLFTDQIIRAPDIINEFYWGVEGIGKLSFLDLFRIDLGSAGWSPYINSGHTNLGGMASIQFLLHNKLIFWLFPAPSSVAWFIVLHLFFGAVGTYLFCRMAGCARSAAFFGGLVFALSTENASLINAGHVMKIATICYAPWAFYFLERGFRSLRPIFFLTTSVVLAFQFFNTHWQIAFYTCLSVALYGVVRALLIIRGELSGNRSEIFRLLGLNLLVLVFFLSTVAISLAPLAKWSTDTNRGVQSGANQGQGGLEREEAMMWSLPPEELASFVIPGLFGLSRQEAGENPKNISAYYWGRMVFTQTQSYLGLLPWLLLPLPLIFRRDRITWLAVLLAAFGIIFSMGKFTPFYNLLYDHFPGINRFRVPKMMMFIPVFALGVLGARGLEILRDDDACRSLSFRRYLYGVGGFILLLGLFLGLELTAGRITLELFQPQIAQPTRYEQGSYLAGQRWDNLVHETCMALLLTAACAALLVARYRCIVGGGVIIAICTVFYVGDVARVNAKFLFTVPVPDKVRGAKTPAMDFLQSDRGNYRTLPMDGSDPMQYATNKIPVMFTSNPVQQRRWQELLDVFAINSAIPDMLNVKYLVFSTQQYEEEKGQLENHYVPVFRSPDNSQIVVENRAVLPKAWLVPSVVLTSDSNQRFSILHNPAFNPALFALVESSPPLQMQNANATPTTAPGQVVVTSHEDVRILLKAETVANSLLVLGERYYNGWKAFVDGQEVPIHPVNHVLRGVYLTPGKHTVEFIFDPLPFKVGKYLTLGSFALFAAMLIREWLLRRKRVKKGEE